MIEQDDNELRIDDEPEEIVIEVVENDDGGTTPDEPGEEPSDEDEAPDEGSESTDIEKLQAEIDHLREMYLRKLAEFDNFRKRIERERIEKEKTAGEGVIRDLIPVIDNF